MQITTGQELKRVRKAMKLSQTKLALILDVSRMSIYKWESSERLPVVTSLAVSKLFEGIDYESVQL